jgi:peptidoglycan/LPS O-acetylase OafA/YrhL
LFSRRKGGGLGDAKRYLDPRPRAASMLRYIKSLDVLRAIAVLLVVFVHVPAELLPKSLLIISAYLQPGYLGVDVFFALSGFLITRILLSERGKPHAWRRFWVRRTLRIFPIYYLLLAICWVLAPGPEMPWVATYTSNFYFIDDARQSYLQHTWSLAIEEHFYLVWPLVVLLGSRRFAKGLIMIGLIPLSIASAYFIIKHDPANQLLMVFHLTPTRILTLALGSLLAFGEGFLTRHRLWTGLAGALLIPFGYGIAYFGYKWPTLRPLTVLWLFVGTALLSTGATLLTIQLNEVAWRGRLATLAGHVVISPLRALGRISYGMYLYHYPILRALSPRMLEAEGAARYGWLALGLLLSVLAATLSYRWIERPILKWSARFRSTERAAPAA